MTIRNKLTAVAATVVVSMAVSFSSHASLVGSGFIVNDNIGKVDRVNVANGVSNGLSWNAQSRIVGSTQDGTGTFPSSEVGNPLYLPSFPLHSGVVGILMEFGNSAFVCSGTLLEDRRSIATAAHCVSSGAGTANPDSTTIYFQPPGGSDPALSVYSEPAGVTTIDVTEYFVHPDYTGEVIDQNDIAILRLSEEAPEWADSYGVYTDGDLTGQTFNVAGYGVRGNGFDGITAGTGRLRQGDNKYDFAFGDSAFGGFFTDNFFGSAEVEFSYVSDHDNGLFSNDQSGLIGEFFGTSEFVDVGLGEIEVGIAGGDSGGPNFINGLLSGINSYGLTFGPNFGDSTQGLDNSFGEISGYVPTWIHADFIANALVSNNVPTPTAFALFGMGLVFMGWKKRKQH